MAKALGVVGLMNVQYAIKDDEIFVLEVNPRAARTVPFVAKATGVAVAKIGARVMAGARLAEFKLDDDSIAPHVAVRASTSPPSRKVMRDVRVTAVSSKGNRRSFAGLAQPQPGLVGPEGRA